MRRPIIIWFLGSYPGLGMSDAVALGNEKTENEEKRKVQCVGAEAGIVLEGVAQVVENLGNPRS